MALIHRSIQACEFHLLLLIFSLILLIIFRVRIRKRFLSILLPWFVFDFYQYAIVVILEIQGQTFFSDKAKKQLIVEWNVFEPFRCACYLFFAEFGGGRWDELVCCVGTIPVHYKGMVFSAFDFSLTSLYTHTHREKIIACLII